MAANRRLEKLADVANSEFGTDEIAIDTLRGEHDLSIGSEGTWVRAWVFLSNDVLQTYGLNDGFSD